MLKHLESDETTISDPRYIVGCWLLEERSGWWRGWCSRLWVASWWALAESSQASRAERRNERRLDSTSGLERLSGGYRDCLWDLQLFKNNLLLDESLKIKNHSRTCKHEQIQADLILSWMFQLKHHNFSLLFHYPERCRNGQFIATTYQWHKWLSLIDQHQFCRSKWKIYFQKYKMESHFIK